MDPVLPPDLPAVAFDVFYRRQRLRVAITGATLHLDVPPCQAAPVRVGVAGEVRTTCPGQHLELLALRPLTGPAA